LDLILIETPDSKYGDYLVKQGQSKEERASGAKTPILGNAKILEPFKKSNKQNQQQQEESTDEW
jgi:hypothetical protein